MAGGSEHASTGQVPPSDEAAPALHTRPGHAFPAAAEPAGALHCPAPVPRAGSAARPHHARRRAADERAGLPQPVRHRGDRRRRAAVDRQHPHDLFMELAAHVDVDLASAGVPDTAAFSIWRPRERAGAGPVRLHAPRLGPAEQRGADHPRLVRFRRTSPMAWSPPGWRGHAWQLEASAFRGQEPGEDRWDIEIPRLNSWPWPLPKIGRCS